MDDEIKKDSEDFPRQWVPREVLLKILRDLPPDPTLLDEIDELGGTLDELEDPWEKKYNSTQGGHPGLPALHLRHPIGLTWRN